MRIKSNNSIAAFIFARGGSKGIPKKNTKELCGHPLIAYSINIALENKNIDKVYVSTDDEEIATISKKYGAEVPFIRPSELAQDNSKEWDAWQHAMNFLKEHNSIPDIMISLPPTSPLRSQKDINACIQKIIETDLDAVIAITPSQRHPMFNMVVKDDSGKIGLFAKTNNNIFRRQDAPKSYDITTIAYAVRSEFILNNDKLFDGKVGAIDVPQERALDIDTEFDFKVASLILESESKD